MDLSDLQTTLSDLPLGPICFFERLDSTNSEAARWAGAGAPDLALVVADEQTAGRGRVGRKWHTPPGAALAFSVVLRGESPLSPSARAAELRLTKGGRGDSWLAGRLTGLGALAVCQALELDYGLPAQIKWPNDVLLKARKTAGVLTEALWLGEELQAVILGVGVNVAAASVPDGRAVDFPATCIEAALGRPVARPELLRSILTHLLLWRMRVAEPEFIRAWEARLAFRGEPVQVRTFTPSGEISVRQAVLLGLDSQGGLRLRGPSGEDFTISVGEIHQHSLRV